MARLAALTGGGRQAASGHVVSAAHVRQKLSQRRLGAASLLFVREVLVVLKTKTMDPTFLFVGEGFDCPSTKIVDRPLLVCWGF